MDGGAVVTWLRRIASSLRTMILGPADYEQDPPRRDPPPEPDDGQDEEAP